MSEKEIIRKFFRASIIFLNHILEKGEKMCIFQLLLWGILLSIVFLYGLDISYSGLSSSFFSCNDKASWYVYYLLDIFLTERWVYKEIWRHALCLQVNMINIDTHLSGVVNNNILFIFYHQLALLNRSPNLALMA